MILVVVSLLSGVIFDHGTYVVVLRHDSDSCTCSCAAKGTCSHILAAAQVYAAMGERADRGRLVTFTFLAVWFCLIALWGARPRGLR